jgi:hypothetical protein
MQTKATDYSVASFSSGVIVAVPPSAVITVDRANYICPRLVMSRFLPVRRVVMPEMC